ncbi:pyridoxamine 5'-phosphate oxidase family protein [Actinomadura kijaniata]|uniref:pyridoxamine 5'-phosphate oxidase family protein n=1 Tax=Actinomadura kijaniata TaxID=46161 RepID=UPI000833B93C|nr:pyridoxamine 5'-phosphate oxidase family protein [Actinomadura kijaniata]
MNDSLPSRLPATERSRHRRLREQGGPERAELDAILAAGFICRLGVVVDGCPMVVPTVYGSDGRHLYLHGSVAGRSLLAASDAEVRVTVTHLDGLVLDRSAFEHGVNHRSAMIYGTPRPVTDPGEKPAGLRLLTEQCAPGQWDYARRPNRREPAATSLLALSLAEASVKLRSGPPDDGDGPNGGSGRWAGVLPLVTTFGEPVTGPPPGNAAAPPHVSARAGAPVG